MIKVNHENKVWKVARVAIAILLVVMCAMTIVAAASGATYNVTIIDNSRSVTISTRAESLMAVLKEADISTDDNDIIVADDFVPGQPSTIRINRGYNVTVTYHGETFKTVGYKNVENVLRQEKLEITDKDIINFSLDNKLSDGMKIVIENPLKVEISVDGEVIVKDAFSANVATILSRCGIDLGEDDIVEPGRKTVIKEDATIVVKRVTFEERTETEKIKYGTTYEDNSKMYKGSTNVKSKGVDGEKEVVYRDMYVDGVKTESEVVSETVIKEAVNKVVVRGTKNAGSGHTSANVTLVNAQTIKTVSNFTLPSKYSIDENLVPTSYTKKFVGQSTAYYGDSGTATGRTPQPGVIAVNPSMIPYGTELWIVSNDGKYVYGYAIAGDTGGFAYNGSGVISDLYFPSEAACVQFGRRDVTIYVLG
ncbi:MAG: G5 domain-containing protein [Clostridia bacterium]|nr:G5 domain-containing protein [Clostridia bacterium]